MVETNSTSPYYAYRRRVREALELHARKPKTAIIPYFFYNVITDVLTEYLGWLDEGRSQRGKKFVSIACMRFVGNNRIALLKWAKSNKKVVK